MHIIPLLRRWLNEAWKRKLAIVATLIAAFSITLAHYAGFLLKMPLPIVAIAGASLAKGVTATFVFYVFFCAVTARVMVYMLQIIVMPCVAMADRLKLGLPCTLAWSRQRRFVRTHSQTIKWEGHLWMLGQVVFTPLLLLGLYVKFTADWLVGGMLAGSLVLGVLTCLLRASFFLQVQPQTFFRKASQRSTRFGGAMTAVFSTGTAVLLIWAYFLGSMRANLLIKQEPYMIVTKSFSGRAAVIARSDEELLVFQRNGTDIRYIYVAPDFTVSMETNAVFTPIGPAK